MMTAASFSELERRVEASRLAAWIDGRAEVGQGPWLLYLSPTNYCNLRCAVCARQEQMREERGMLSPAAAEKILSRLPDTIHKIYLQKQGEPTMNPQLAEIARLVRQRFPKAQLAMHTNGLLMTAKLAEALAPLFDFTAFSISAITRQTYAACHGRDRFTQALAGLRAFLDARKALDRWDNNVFIDYVRQSGNRAETPEAVAAFFRTYFGELNSVDIHWTDSFQGAIEEARFVPAEHLDERRLPRCTFPWGTLTVLHDGRLTYCFVEPKENVIWGSLLEHSFEELWNGPEYVAFRRAMAEGRLSELARQGFGCRECAWLWSTQAQKPAMLGLGMGDLEPDLSSFAPASPEDLGLVGLKHLATGQFAAAAGTFDWALGQSPEPALAERLAHWKRKAEAGLALSWPRPDWVRALARCNRTPADLRSQYIRFRPPGQKPSV
ncbi:MAG: radical SAM protein [Myxococcales bacterium]|nr:MAG: radical SAM protein [Myxococcales bacterium]